MKVIKPARPVWICLASLFLVSGTLLAHDAGLSSVDLRFETNRLDAEITLSIIDMTRAVGNLESRTPLDSSRDGRITEEEFAAGLERLRTWAANVLKVQFDSQPVAAKNPSFILDETNNCHIRLSFPGSRPAHLAVEAALFEYLPGRHQQYLTLADESGKVLGGKMLTPQATVFEFNFTNAPDTDQPRVNSFGSFLLLGVEHILTGYDHLMFLLALLLVCRGFKPAVQIITCFTIAHSITLAAATFNVVQMPSRIVEPMIAASITYVALENLARPEGPKGR